MEGFVWRSDESRGDGLSGRPPIILSNSTALTFRVSPSQNILTGLMFPESAYALKAVTWRNFLLAFRNLIKLRPL